MQDIPGVVEDAAKSGGFEVDIGGNEAFVDLAGDGEEDIGDIDVGHDQVFAGVDVDDVIAGGVVGF